jgi:hypothetical protein
MFYGYYIYAMGSIMQKHDNLVKLLDGLSLLDGQDQERIISVVDTLDFTEKKIKKEIYNDKKGERKKREQGTMA